MMENAAPDSCNPRKKEEQTCWADLPASPSLSPLIAGSVAVRQVCQERHRGRISSRLLQRGEADVRRDAGAGQRLRAQGLPSALPRNVFTASPTRFGALCACFYSVDPQLGCHCKSWLCLHQQPSSKRFKSQARSRERGLVPAGPGASRVGPASAVWPCAFAGNFGLFLFLIFPFLPLLEHFKWSCG